MSRLRRLGRAIRQNLGTVLAVTSIAFTLVYVHYEEHLFCQVTSAITAVPVPRPPDPKANPSRENQYEWYQRFLSLNRSLGC